MPYGKKKDSAVKMGHEKSPAEMGHKGDSAAKMGHKGDSPAKMESAKQERKNLLQDNPVAKHASGSWLSKHASHSRMSPAKMGHEDSPAKKSPLYDQHPDGEKMTVYEDRKNQKGESQLDVINKADSEANKAISEYEKLKFLTEDQYNKALAATKRPQFVRDSIKGANVKMDKLFSDIKSGKY